jgi:hypothetical protein
MKSNRHFDPKTIAVLRRALDDVVQHQRFVHRTSVSALEIAEHLLEQAAEGERDFDRLKMSAFAKLAAAA